MNVLLHRSKILLAFLACLFLSSFVKVTALYGQAPTLDIHDLRMVKNDTLEFNFETYQSAFEPQKKRPTSGPAYSYSRFTNPHTGNRKFGIAGAPANNTIFYMPPSGFIGRDTIEILRWIEGPGYSSKEAYIILHITVVPSHITAMPDYVATDMGQSIEIDVLDNDYGNGTYQKIAEVTNKNRGDAQLNSDSTKVIFTPSSGFEGISHFNYSICDLQGACDMTTVSICVMNPNPPAYDSIYVQTKEDEPQVILMALDTNYTVTLAPQHGVATDTGDVWTYVPDANYSGIDKVVFEDATNNRTRVFQIEVIGPAPYQPIFLNDDIVYTPKDEAIEEIHLLANDDGGPYFNIVSRINEWPNGDTKEGGDLVYLPYIGKGVYQYNPPTGFTGVDLFRYKVTVPGGGLTDTATCYIIVDDLQPEKPVYELVVPEATPLVLGDHLPFLGYEYDIESAPSNGTLEYFQGNHTYTNSNGHEFSGYNMLVYEPSGNAGTSDAFEVNYRSTFSSPWEKAKVELTIVDIITPQSDTLCAGSDCIWPGDTDNNGKIDISDLLPIGLCMGEVGLNRSVGADEYYAQHANNWNSLFRNDLGYDVKHVDADGNGIISSDDTTAIGLYYGKYNNLVPTAPAPLSELPFYPDPFPGGPPQPGDVILIPLHLGNSNIPAFDAYGLTFNVDYDPALFESVKVFWNDDAWMNYNSPILSMSHEPHPGRLDAGYTRTSGLAATGHGVIGILEFIIVEDITGFRPNEEYSTIQISGSLMNSGGQNNSLGQHTLTFSLGMNEEEEDDTRNDIQDNLKVYPNPSSDIINIHLNGQENLMERIVLYNMVGAEVYDSGNILAKRTRMDVAGLNPGVYVMRVWSNGGMMTAKVEVMR